MKQKLEQVIAKHDRLTFKIKKVIAYLEDQREFELDEHDQGAARAYEIAASELREVLAGDEQIQSQEMPGNG